VPVENGVWGVAAGTGRGAEIDGRGGGGGDGAVRRQASGGAEPGRSFHLRLAPRALASTATPHPLPNEFGWAPLSFLSRPAKHFFHLSQSPLHLHTIRKQLHPGRWQVASNQRPADLKRETDEGLSVKGQIWTGTMMAGGPCSPPRGHTGLASRARNVPRPSVSGRTARMRAKGFRGRFPGARLVDGQDEGKPPDRAETSGRAEPAVGWRIGEAAGPSESRGRPALCPLVDRDLDKSDWAGVTG